MTRLPNPFYFAYRYGWPICVASLAAHFVFWALRGDWTEPIADIAALIAITAGSLALGGTYGREEERARCLVIVDRAIEKNESRVVMLGGGGGGGHE